MQKAQEQMEQQKLQEVERQQQQMVKQEIITPGATPRRTPSRIGL